MLILRPKNIVVCCFSHIVTPFVGKSIPNVFAASIIAFFFEFAVFGLYNNEYKIVYVTEPKKLLLNVTLKLAVWKYVIISETAVKLWGLTTLEMIEKRDKLMFIQDISSQTVLR